MCNAVGTLTVRDLCRTEHSASIVTWTAIYMTLMALPALPFFWVTPTPFDFLLLPFEVEKLFFDALDFEIDFVGSGGGIGR